MYRDARIGTGGKHEVRAAPQGGHAQEAGRRQPLHAQDEARCSPSKLHKLGASFGATASKKGSATTKSIRPSTFDLKKAAKANDLSDDAPAPGDQGQTSSCSTWASGYSVMGWWANHAGLDGTPYAPMFLYSQIVKGNCDEGTDIRDSLAIMQDQGIPSDGSYQPMQSQLDCKLHEFGSSTLASAGQHRISGYEDLDVSDPKTAIIEQLSAGRPVILGIEIYNNFENADSESFLIDAPPSGEKSLGGHAIAAFAYDDQGVWILNSWTSDWGSNGWAELSWDFVTGQGDEFPNVGDAHVITGVVAP